MFFLRVSKRSPLCCWSRMEQLPQPSLLFLCQVLSKLFTDIFYSKDFYSRLCKLAWATPTVFPQNSIERNKVKFFLKKLNYWYKSILFIKIVVSWIFSSLDIFPHPLSSHANFSSFDVLMVRSPRLFTDKFEMWRSCKNFRTD